VDADAIRDLFGALGAVDTRRMFGGHGIYLEGRILALEIGGEIYIKAGEGRGSLPRRRVAAVFVRPQRQDRDDGLLTLPESAVDDPEEAAGCARMSLAADEPPPKRRRRR
jgi:DNA transformation protein